MLGIRDARNLSDRFDLLAIALIICSIAFKTFLVITVGSNNAYLENDSSRYLSLSSDFWNNFFGNQTRSNWDAFYITPGFPFFLHVLQTLEIQQIIIFQFIILGITQFLLYKVLKRIFSYRLSILGLTLYALESSSNLESFHILTETLFALFFVLFFLCVSNPRFSLRIALVAGFTLGISLLIRPVGQIIIVALLISIAFSSHKKKLFACLLIALALQFSWIARNNIVYGVPQLSGIQSLNLLYFEGAGARAIDTGLTLQEAQTFENSREIATLGPNPSLRDVVDYRQERGFELIKSFPSGFFELHIVGSLKILFGPGSATLEELFDNKFPFSQQTILVYKVVSLALSFSLALLSFSSIILLVFQRKSLDHFTFRFAGILLVLLLVSSSGANAYSRFRVPLVPLEILLSLFMVKLLLHRFRINRSGGRTATSI